MQGITAKTRRTAKDAKNLIPIETFKALLVCPVLARLFWRPWLLGGSLRLGGYLAARRLFLDASLNL